MRFQTLCRKPDNYPVLTNTFQNITHPLTIWRTENLFTVPRSLTILIQYVSPHVLMGFLLVVSLMPVFAAANHSLMPLMIFASRISAYYHRHILFSRFSSDTITLFFSFFSNYASF